MTTFEHQKSNIILVKLKLELILVLYTYLIITNSPLEYLFLFHNMPCMSYITPAVLNKMCVYENIYIRVYRIRKFEEFYFTNSYYRNINHLHILISRFQSFCWREHIKKVYVSVNKCTLKVKNISNYSLSLADSIEGLIFFIRLFVAEIFGFQNFCWRQQMKKMLISA